MLRVQYLLNISQSLMRTGEAQEHKFFVQIQTQDINVVCILIHDYGKEVHYQIPLMVTDDVKHFVKIRHLIGLYLKMTFLVFL